MNTIKTEEKKIVNLSSYRTAKEMILNINLKLELMKYKTLKEDIN